MHEEAPQELASWERHHLPFLSVLRPVLEGDVGVGDVDDPMVGECGPVDVSGEVLEDDLGALLCDVDMRMPLDAADGPREVETRDLGAQGLEELGFEDLCESFLRCEAESVDPLDGAVWSACNCGHEAVDVGVVHEGPGPGMEDGHDGRVTAESLGLRVSGELEDGLSGRLEQERVSVLLELPDDEPELLRDGEDDVEVGDWK